MLSAKKLAFGFFGLVLIGSFGLVLFSPGQETVSTANIGGLQFKTLTDPMALDTELQGTFFAYEVLPLHQPALPFGHEFDNTVNQEFIEVDSNTLFAEILAEHRYLGSCDAY